MDAKNSGPKFADRPRPLFLKDCRPLLSSYMFNLLSIPLKFSTHKEGVCATSSVPAPGCDSSCKQTLQQTRHNVVLAMLLFLSKVLLVIPTHQSGNRQTPWAARWARLSLSFARFAHAPNLTDRCGGKANVKTPSKPPVGSRYSWMIPQPSSHGTPPTKLGGNQAGTNILPKLFRRPYRTCFVYMCCSCSYLYIQVEQRPSLVGWRPPFESCVPRKLRATLHPRNESRVHP